MYKKNNQLFLRETMLRLHSVDFMYYKKNASAVIQYLKSLKCRENTFDYEISQINSLITNDYHRRSGEVDFNDELFPNCHIYYQYALIFYSIKNNIINDNVNYLFKREEINELYKITSTFGKDFMPDNFDDKCEKLNKAYSVIDNILNNAEERANENHHPFLVNPYTRYYTKNREELIIKANKSMAVFQYSLNYLLKLKHKSINNSKNLSIIKNSAWYERGKIYIGLHSKTDRVNQGNHLHVINDPSWLSPQITRLEMYLKEIKSNALDNQNLIKLCEHTISQGKDALNKAYLLRSELAGVLSMDENHIGMEYNDLIDQAHEYYSAKGISVFSAKDIDIANKEAQKLIHDIMIDSEETEMEQANQPNIETLMPQKEINFPASNTQKVKTTPQNAKRKMHKTEENLLLSDNVNNLDNGQQQKPTGYNPLLVDENASFNKIKQPLKKSQNFDKKNNKKKQNNYAFSNCFAAMFGWIGPKTKSAAGTVVVASASGYTAATVQTSVAASSVKFASLPIFLGFAGTCTGGLLMGAGVAFGLAIAAAYYKKYYLSAGLSSVGIGLTGATVLAITNSWNPIGLTLISIGVVIAVGALIGKMCSLYKSSKNAKSKTLTAALKEEILQEAENLDEQRYNADILVNNNKNKVISEYRESVQSQIEFLRDHKGIALDGQAQDAYDAFRQPHSGLFDKGSVNPSVFNPDAIQEQKNAIATIRNWANSNRSSETQEVEELETRVNDYEYALTSIENQYNQFKNKYFDKSDSYQDIENKLIEFKQENENTEQLGPVLT